MSTYLNKWAMIPLLMILTGCISQSPQALVKHQNVAQLTVAESTAVSAVNPVADKDAFEMHTPPLQVASWSPKPTDGRYLAMGSGYLTTYNNCLTLTTGDKNAITKDNTHLLVLADDSFSWDADNEILTIENQSYKLGDELYYGGTVFTYPNRNLTDHIKINWIDCGLNTGWLGI